MKKLKDVVVNKYRIIFRNFFLDAPSFFAIIDLKGQ